jgi:IclR family pca regulon transcriptional regulator
MGRVLLAALPPDRARTLLAASERQKLTSRTLTDIDELMVELEKVRTQGYAIIDQELELGSRSIAVPIRDLSRQTVAAFNVGTHVSHSTLERLREEFLPPLLEAQRQLAEILP